MVRKLSLLLTLAVGVLLYSCSETITEPEAESSAATDDAVVAEFLETGVVPASLTKHSANRFTAQLSGDQEVPPVATDGQGFAIFRLAKRGTLLKYKIFVKDTPDITQAHIHLAPAGSNGPVGAFLFGFVTGGVNIDGRLVSGKLTDADLLGPLAGMTLADLVAEFNAGNAYVNVHTVANAPGELRGQIQ